MSFYRTPFWLSQPQRARLRHFVALGSLALPLAGLAGCAQQASSPTDATPSSSSSWGAVLQNWWKSTTNTPKAIPAPTPGTPLTPPSQSEIARLAHQHPAWKLANALQENRISPLQFEAISPDTTPDSTLARPSFDVQFSTGNEFSSPRTDSALPPPATVVPGDEGITRVEFGDLHEAARTQQETSLTDFLHSVAVRQQDWQRDYRAILQVALSEDVEAAARRVPQVIPLVQPSPEVQLEMTNLRLRLLRNVFTTQEERDVARNRLRELLLQWRAALREQEVARTRELQRLRTEEPERIRQQGLANIEQELDAIQRTRQELRNALAAEHRARLEEDFGNDRARLALSFPSPLPGDFLETTRATSNSPAAYGKTVLEQLIFHRTPFPNRTSNTVLPGIAAQRSSSAIMRAAQIRALRRQAWSDATRQAKMATRLGY